MTLQKRIAELPEISPQTIKGKFTFEEFKFEILECMAKPPVLDQLSNLFNEVDSLLVDQPDYNYFREAIALKTLYLHTAYGLDYDVINAMLVSAPILVIDMSLNEILEQDKYFTYLKEAFKEHKIYNGTTLATVMKYLSTIDIAPLAKELEQQVGELSKLAKTK